MAAGTVDAMEPIPRHWAAVRETHTFPGQGPFALTSHGSSDVSVEDARRDARERMDPLVAAGGPSRSTTRAWSTTLTAACRRSCSRRSMARTAR